MDRPYLRFVLLSTIFFYYQEPSALLNLPATMQSYRLPVLLAVSWLTILLIQAEVSVAWPVAETMAMPPWKLFGSRPLEVRNTNDHTVQQWSPPADHYTPYLKRRMMPGFTTVTRRIQLHNSGFTSFSIITPIAAAARALEDFYAQLAIKASTVWITEPERSAFSFRMGNFKLNFRCEGDTIPWRFVKDIAERLWECACLQFTELFEVVYSNPVENIVVTVWLELVERSPSPDECHFDCPGL